MATLSELHKIGEGEPRHLRRGRAFMGFSLVFAIDRLPSADIAVDFAPLQLVIVLVAGDVLGYIAALIPAMRSTKPEVLDAIQVTRPPGR